MEKRISTRDRILNVSEELFSELGYSGTSIAAIAKEIGIQKSSLYAHFADKEQLFLEVFQRFHDETALKLSAIFLTELPDKEKLHEVFLLFCTGRNANIFRIGLLPNPECKDKAQQIIATFEENFRLMLKALFQHIDQNGPVITKDYDQAFQLLVFLINGVMTIGGRYDCQNEIYRHEIELAWQAYCELIGL